MRGRKPKPTQLRLVHGDRGKRPAKGPEPVPASALSAEPPPGLEGDAAGCWRYVMREAPENMLRTPDAFLLEVFCRDVALYREACAQIAKWGAVIKAPKTDMPLQSPWVAIRNSSRAGVLKVAAELGLGPVARARLAQGGSDGGGGGENAGPGDALDAFLG